MIKTIIVEDELPARNMLKHYIQRHSQLEVAAECANGFEGAKAVNYHRPDLVFLDIQMPKLNGFEMLELIDQMPAVIFTTAYDEYAVKAFETNAVDYLLKPFDEQRFDSAIQKALQRIDENSESRIATVAEAVSDNPVNQIVVPNGHKIEMLMPEDIFLIEAQDDYVLIHTLRHQYLKKKTMNFYEKHLDHRFLRIHRSYIVNMQQIDNIELYAKQQYQLKLKNDTIVKTSKSGYKKIREKFFQ